MTTADAAAAANEVKVSGTVKWYDPNKSFGFIGQANGQDVFVHANDIQKFSPSGKTSLEEGEIVEFIVVTGHDGKPRADKITGPGGVDVKGSSRQVNTWNAAPGGGFGGMNAPAFGGAGGFGMMGQQKPPAFFGGAHLLGGASGGFTLAELNGRRPTMADWTRMVGSGGAGRGSMMGGGGMAGGGMGGGMMGGGNMNSWGGGGGGGNRRPGDWDCPKCHAHNYADKTACFKCGETKPAGAGGGGFGGGGMMMGGGGFGAPAGGAQFGAPVAPAQVSTTTTGTGEW